MTANNFIQSAWSWLGRELDRWSDSGLQARIWWRDDDASRSSEQLQRLLQLSQRRQVPLALAVIPASVEPGLAGLLGEHDLVSVLQHGYAHDSHASRGQRKIEFGGTRSTDDLARDLASGRDILQRHFGADSLPVLVPPWNRIEQRVVERLPELGFRGYSTLKARRQSQPAAKLLQVNVHLDPINWSQQDGFKGVYPAIAVLIQHLVARRSGYRDLAEPSGILSHHLVQNEATWQFLDDLLGFLGQHPAATFVDARDIWS